MAFWRLTYHLVWATKNREHFVRPEIEKQLYAYIVRKAAELDVFVYAINGWYDHVISSSQSRPSTPLLMS